MTRLPYFLVIHVPARTHPMTITGEGTVTRPEHWLVRFRGGNHKIVFNGQQWHSEDAALHAIDLIDPGGVHPVKHRERRT